MGALFFWRQWSFGRSSIVGQARFASIEHTKLSLSELESVKVTMLKEPTKMLKQFLRFFGWGLVVASMASVLAP